MCCVYVSLVILPCTLPWKCVVVKMWLGLSGCSLFIHRFVSCIQWHIKKHYWAWRIHSFPYIFFFSYIISRLVIYIREHTERLIENGCHRYLLLPHRDVRKKKLSRRCRDATAYKKNLTAPMLRLYWTRKIGTRPSDSFSLRVFHL